MQLTDAAMAAAIATGLFMTGVWLLSLRRKDTSIVDVAWGLGFVVIAWLLPRMYEGELSQIYRLVQTLITIWGIRLFVHILLRKAGKPEDWRYQQWREEWGRNHWWRSILQVFVLQALLMLVIASPLYVAAGQTSDPGQLAWIGASLWLVGFFFEAVGDWQLAKFLAKRAKQSSSKKAKKKRAKSSIMQTGLWRYTRHPNYFGEMTQWWGIWLIVASQTNGWLALVSPVMISFLLLKVSGITMLEKRFEGNKEFESYRQRTSPIIPLPPKNV